MAFAPAVPRCTGAGRARRLQTALLGIPNSSWARVTRRWDAHRFLALCGITEGGGWTRVPSAHAGVGGGLPRCTCRHGQESVGGFTLLWHSRGQGSVPRRSAVCAAAGSAGSGCAAGRGGSSGTGSTLNTAESGAAQMPR